jgi:hypothetical protein
MTPPVVLDALYCMVSYRLDLVLLALLVAAIGA